MLFRLICLTVTLFTIGCTQPPAKVVQIKSPASTKEDFSTSSDINIINPYKVNVKQGETLYQIARENNVPLRDIIDENGLRPPYKLYPGQQLKLPKATYHVVQPRDTLYSISRGYEVDMTSLVRLNNIDSPYVIRSGQRLKIPSKNEQAEEIVDSSDEEPTYYSASKTEEVESTSLTPLKTANNNTEKNIPSPVIRRESTNTSLSSSSSKGFIWPTKGQVISGFGPKKGGLYNDGVNISVKEGTPVKAAADGKVVYSGNALRGYGNLLLIKHNNGYLTAYAHTDKISVKKGDIVQQGQIVALAGKTGNVDKPQLHFSIRKGRKAVNPKDYL